MVAVMFIFLDGAAIFLFTGSVARPHSGVRRRTQVQPELSMKVTQAEKEVVELLRALEYGELRVMVKDSNPIRVEEIRRSIQLTGER